MKTKQKKPTTTKHKPKPLPEGWFLEAGRNWHFPPCPFHANPAMPRGSCSPRVGDASSGQGRLGIFSHLVCSGVGCLTLRALRGKELLTLLRSSTWFLLYIFCSMYFFKGFFNDYVNKTDGSCSFRILKSITRKQVVVWLHWLGTNSSERYKLILKASLLYLPSSLRKKKNTSLLKKKL